MYRNISFYCCQIPATMNQFLREYQREGVKFMYTCFAKGCGALLADDMGLGKTIQVIALLAAQLHKTGTEKDINRFRSNVILKVPLVFFMIR